MQGLTDSRLKTWLVRLGIDRLLRPVLGGRGVILALHRVRFPGEDLIFDPNRANMIAPDRLAGILEALLAARVPIVTLDAALDRLRAKAREPFVSLTFDDGYIDNYEELLPLVERLRVPVTVYIAPCLLDGTAPLWWYGLDNLIARHSQLDLPLDGDCRLFVGTAGQKRRAFARCLDFMLQARQTAQRSLVDAMASRYEVSWTSLARQHMMRWEQVAELARSPLVEIGAHTLTHPNLAALDVEGALAEMSGSAERLARELGRPIVHFAFPFGTRRATGPREACLAARVGFASSVTTRPGNLFARHLAHLHALPRHGLAPHDGVAALALKRAGVKRMFHVS